MWQALSKSHCSAVSLAFMVGPISEPPSALQQATASAEGVVLVLTTRRRFSSAETCELTLISPMKSAQGSVVACIVSNCADGPAPAAETQQRISIGEPLHIRVRGGIAASVSTFSLFSPHPAGARTL